MFTKIAQQLDSNCAISKSEEILLYGQASNMHFVAEMEMECRTLQHSRQALLHWATSSLNYTQESLCLLSVCALLEMFESVWVTKKHPYHINYVIQINVWTQVVRMFEGRTSSLQDSFSWKCNINHLNPSTHKKLDMIKWDLKSRRLAYFNK